MRNILSYQPGTLFSGEEILVWAKYQVDNETSHYQQGKRILELYSKTLKCGNYYQVYSSYESWSCGDCVHKPLVLRNNKTSNSDMTTC